jgi:hypothetical protein
MIEEAEVEATTVFIQIALNFVFICALTVYVYFRQDWAKATDDNEGENLVDNIKEDD